MKKQYSHFIIKKSITQFYYSYSSKRQIFSVISTLVPIPSPASFSKSVILNKSVIGNDASIKGTSQSLIIGENTEIDFS